MLVVCRSLKFKRFKIKCYINIWVIKICMIFLWNLAISQNFRSLELQFRKICLLLSFVHMSLIFGIFILIFKTVFKISGFIEIWRSRIQLPVFEVIRNFYVNFSIEICEIFWRLLPSLNFITDISGVCEISVSRNTYLLYF